MHAPVAPDVFLHRPHRPLRPRPSPRPRSCAFRARRPAGFTLVEVLVGMMVSALLFCGLFATIVQIRNLTEASIAENSTTTIVQGYLEQLKSLPYETLWTDANHDRVNDVTRIPTRLDGLTPDALLLSTGPVPDLATLDVNASAPAGVVDNTRQFDLNHTPRNPADDLRLTLWLWITPMDDRDQDVRNCLRITIAYTRDDRTHGTRPRQIIHTMRSFIPSL